MKFISEIASTHNGNIRDVYFLTNKHLKTNSNFIKYQIFKTEKLYSRDDKEFKEYKNLEISQQAWKKIINKYKKKTKIILEPFDHDSYLFCEKFSNHVNIKISTSETDNSFLIKKALKKFRKVFLNFSGYTIDEIKIILKNINGYKFRKKLVLMYGFQSYPSKIEDYRIAIFDFFKKNHFSYGFADHSIYGLSEDLISNLFLSIQKKCSFFEKHVCKDILKKPDDYIASVEFPDLEKLIKISKKFQVSLRKNNNKLKDPEKKYISNMHKKAFVTKDIQIGKRLDINFLIFLRTNKKGLRRLDLLGKRFVVKKKLKKNSFLNLSDLEIK